jgi:hypothetical protein
MDKKYLIIVRIHNQEAIEMFRGEEGLIKQAEKWKLELSKVLTLGGFSLAMIALPDGIDLEITRIDE